MLRIVSVPHIAAPDLKLLVNGIQFEHAFSFAVFEEPGPTKLPTCDDMGDPPWWALEMGQASHFEKSAA